MSKTRTVNRKQNNKNKRKTRKVKGGTKCNTEYIINFIKNEFRDKIKNIRVGDYSLIYLKSGENQFNFDISVKKIVVHSKEKNINMNERLSVVALSGFSVENICEKYDKQIFTELLNYFIQETRERGYDGFMVDDYSLDGKYHRKKLKDKLGFLEANEFETNLVNKQYVLLFNDYSSFRIDTRVPLDVHRSRSTRRKKPLKSYDEFESPFLRLSPSEIPDSPERPFFEMEDEKIPYETDEEIQLRKDMDRLRKLGWFDKR
jgi:hypothetical protein